MSNIQNTDVRERTKQIIGILPGVDCGGYGGCKLPSCEACAKAIAEGASVATCPACSQKDVDAIAVIMGVDSIKVKKEIAFIKCSGKTARKQTYAKGTTCSEAVKAGFLKEECSYGCVGLGSCIERCKFGAMSLEENIVKVDKDKCTGCMACVDFCPQNLVVMAPADATNFIPCASQDDEEHTKAVCGAGCIACRECVDACPLEAVSIINNHAVIDYSKCVGCVACTVVCRKKIIVDNFHSLVKLKSQVAFVRCAGGVNAKSKFEGLGIKTCSEAAKVTEKYDDICSAGCTGLGDCTKVCRYDALTVKDSVAYVDAEKCVGCLDCVDACPKHLITAIPYKGTKLIPCSSNDSEEQKAKYCRLGCTGCGDCVANCPSGALSLDGGHAVIDCNICENCTSCTYICSRNVPREQAVPEATYLQMDALCVSERK
ncbi:MAG: 4Fe-4S dicluster domain-containing protein [Oscillospiraceae bacterium]